MKISMRGLCLAAITSAVIGSSAQQTSDFDPQSHSTFTTDRSDGKYVSSRAIAHNLMVANPPRLHYKSGMSPREFATWKDNMATAMRQLMNYPEANISQPPVKVKTVERDGYRVEKWEAYPLEGAVVPYLVMIPDGVNAEHKAPALLCIPGFGQTKELLAGETAVDLDNSTVNPTKNAMGYYYVKEGYVAVVVDNPGCGEPSDIERLAGSGADYVTLSRALLELDWSYLGYTAFVDHYILNWMKTQPEMRSDRIVVSGFSLGTEPLMAIGVTDPDIFAFVYNDFLCTTRERALVMTLPNANGYRPWPNDISHLIPGFLTMFDFPDIVAALAPRPVICTEGGMDRDFNMVADAFATAGAPDAFSPHHYAMFVEDSSRTYLDEMPKGIDRATFFKLANVDPPHHYFKAEHILPWLRTILAD